jgi:Subtilase family
MHHRRHRLATIAAGVTAAASAVGAASVAALPAAAEARPAVVAAAGAAPAAAAPAAAAPAAAAPAAARGAARPSPRAIVLVNGDEIMSAAAPGGRRFGEIVSAVTGIGGTLTTLRLNGKTYEIPLVALPYLGRGLDPSLFDVSALTGHESGGRLPVRVGFQGRPPALPGVQVTHKGTVTEDGYLTRSSARLFGAALTHQFAADHSHGSYGRDGMFAGGVSVSLAGAAAHPAVTPAYVLHTLTVRGTDASGKPDEGDLVLVLNVDDGSLFSDPVEAVNDFFNGVAKFSVPSGHYWALGIFFGLTQQSALRADVLPQFTAGKGTTVRVDARAATSEVTLVTPKPSIAQALSVEIRRAPAKGFANAFTFGSIGAGGGGVWVNPTRTPVTVGELQTFTDGLLTAANGPTARYEYDLAFAGPAGIVPPQHIVARPAGLARVDARYYDAVTAAGSLGRAGLFPPQLQDGIFFVNSFPFSLPQRRTEYTSSGPSLAWLSVVTDSQGDTIQADVFRRYHGHAATVEDWNSYPLHPGVNFSAITGSDDFINLPSAARAGDTLSLDVTPFSDNLPGHLGEGFGTDGSGAKITGSFEIDQNGRKIAGGTVPALSPPDLFVTGVRLSPTPAAIRFVLNAARSGGAYPLARASQTIWTWNSAHEAATVLPAGWLCAATFTTGVLNRDCRVEPVLTLRYAVAGMALDGSVAAGPQELDFSAGHLQLAREARITGATVAVSFDGGATWQPAVVNRRHGGSFRAFFTAPPPGHGAAGYVTLRVAAAGAAGSAITETITRAYQIAPVPAANVSLGRTLAPPAPASWRPPAPRAACPPVRPGYARCLTLYTPQTPVNRALAAQLAGRAGAAGPAVTPLGWGARSIESAYKLPIGRTSHTLVAIVDAFGDRNLAADLAVYRKQYHLPACTTASRCLRKVNQRGKAAPLPQTDPGWEVETTLDAAMVSAACPHCKILVVEADSNSLADLAAAENTAARLGARVVSDSWGGREDGFALTYAKSFSHPGHVIVASTGDVGFTAAQFPANLATVTAVGGTQLARAHNKRGWAEQVWNDPSGGASGSGCSAYVAKPAWQHDSHCSMRTAADVSALAMNVPIYNKDAGGWITVEGTSASAPLIAGVYALAGNAATVTPRYPYRHARSLFDVTSGDNDWFNGSKGATCGFDYLCTAKKGYDAPTGLGTPDGTGAF